MTAAAVLLPTDVARQLLELGLNDWVVMRMVALECAITEHDAWEALLNAGTPGGLSVTCGDD